MLSNLSPFSGQGLTTSFPGVTGGFSPMNSNPFGQLGAYGGNAGFGQEAFGQNPALTGQTQQIIAVLAQLAQHISAHSVLAQQIGVTLQQIVQQLAMQSLQRSGAAGAGLQLHQGGYPGLNAQPYAQQPYGGLIPQAFNPQGQGWGPQTQGWGPQTQGWGSQAQGWGPQALGWGANRQSTIQ